MSSSQSSIVEPNNRVHKFELPQMVEGRCDIYVPINFIIGVSQILGFNLKTEGGTRTLYPRLLSIGPVDGANPATTTPHLFVGAGPLDTSIYTLYWINNEPTIDYKNTYSLLPNN